MNSLFCWTESGPGRGVGVGLAGPAASRGSGARRSPRSRRRPRPCTRASAGPPAPIAGSSRSSSMPEPRSPSASTRAALSAKYRYSTGLVTPASAATASIGSSGPWASSTRSAAATNSRRAARPVRAPPVPRARRPGPRLTAAVSLRIMLPEVTVTQVTVTEPDRAKPRRRHAAGRAAPGHRTQPRADAGPDGPRAHRRPAAAFHRGPVLRPGPRYRLVRSAGRRQELPARAPLLTVRDAADGTGSARSSGWN